MALAAIESPQQAGAGTSGCSTSGCSQGQEFDPPAFRGVFRSALHAADLLPALLQMVKHRSSSVAEYEGTQLDASCGNSSNNTTLCSQVRCHRGEPHQQTSHARPCAQQSPLLVYAGALLLQVVAAAVQLMVSINVPLPAATCTAVLDYLSQQLEASTGAAHMGRPSISEGGSHGTCLWTDLPHHTATLWCLTQHCSNRLLLLQDGRWAELLQRCMHPACQRLRRYAAGTRRKVSGWGSASGASAATAATSTTSGTVPRLPLQQVLEPGWSAACSSSGSGTTAVADSSSGSNSGHVKRTAEAVRVVRCCLQSCWLLLHQDVCQRRLDEELPPGADAVYVRGRSSWWCAGVQPPR